MKIGKHFKPYIGRCFELKNYTDMKKFPPVILVLDEKPKEVMFLDLNIRPTWIAKSFLRDTPIPSEHFAGSDTVEKAMMLIENLRKTVVDLTNPEDARRIKAITKECTEMMETLRHLADQIQGVQIKPIDNQSVSL